MRYLKMLGLAMLIALATMALVSASSASATTLCGENEDPCPEEQIYATGTNFEAVPETATTAYLNTNAIDIECKTSKPSGKLVESNASIEEWPFACNRVGGGGAACASVTTLGLPYNATFQPTGLGDGTMTLGLNTQVTCAPAGINCTFISAKPTTEVEGGTPAILNFASGQLVPKGASCPKEAEWTAEYKVLSPEPLFLVSEPVAPVLCKEDKAPCPVGEILGTGTTIKASLAATFKFVYTYEKVPKEPSCTESTMEGKTTTETGNPIIGEVTSLTFGQCAGGACAIEALGLPYRMEIERTSDGSETLTLRKKNTGPPAVKIKCGGLFENCAYETTELTFNVQGGAPAKFYWPTKVGLTGSSLFCSTTATWEGIAGQEINYKITTPNPFYVKS